MSEEETDKEKMLKPNKYHIDDFEEAFRVIKIDEENYIGAHPLEKPIKQARGVYGGHTVAQTLLVAIESTRDPHTQEVFIPDSFHTYFIAAGESKVPMEYKVAKLFDDGNIAKRSITVIQMGRVRCNCICSLYKRGGGDHKPSRQQLDVDFQIPTPPLQLKYPDVDKLYQIQHTGYIRNAYSEEFLDYNLCPEEDLLKPAERWITVWSGIKNQPLPGHEDKYEIRKDNIKNSNDKIVTIENKIINRKHLKSFKDPMYNYVGLADLSDSALLTTMARVLHIPWNPTQDHAFEEYDDSKDAVLLLGNSINMLHLFHYNAMSLDHHIYFHNDHYEDSNDPTSYDIVREWLCFTYQMKRLSNNRTLVRGFLFNEHKKCVATIVQEGLTYLFNGVPDNAKL
ncbi:thioesterase-like superfamily-domain-containing protein [Scheffersomyces coipomensis]|uniref:thioesterase-like superfamily-domain-containing protein n=1 Tax=Scheffersomyces coipomensis TaxID=1788519 RepID=UPI00315D6DD4